MKKIILVFMAAMMLLCIGCAPDKNNNNVQTTPNATERPSEVIPTVMPTDTEDGIIDDAIDSLETVMPELVPSDGSGDYDAEADGEVDNDNPAGTADVNASASPKTSTAPVK